MFFQLLLEGGPRAGANSFLNATFPARTGGRHGRIFENLKEASEEWSRLTNHLTALCHSTQPLVR